MAAYAPNQVPKFCSAKQTIRLFALLGLLYGLYSWALLQSYLWASDHAWWTGAAPSELSDVLRRMVRAKFGLDDSFWPLPSLLGVFGFVVGILLAACKCDLALIWNALWFAARVTWRLRWWALCLLLLPVLCLPLIGSWSFALPVVLSVVAIFLTGHIDSYRDVTQFRLRWSAPGWFALLACCGLWVFAYLLDQVMEHYLDTNGYVYVGMAVSFGLELVLTQLYAALWLTRCKDIMTLRVLVKDSMSFARMRDTLAFELALVGLLLVVALPLLAIMVFAVYEAAQLQSNLKSIGVDIGFGFHVFMTSCDLIASYWKLLLTPFSVVLSIAAAKLWLEFEARSQCE
jgi:hypothetical protein